MNLVFGAQSFFLYPKHTAHTSISLPRISPDSASQPFGTSKCGLCGRPDHEGQEVSMRSTTVQMALRALRLTDSSFSAWQNTCNSCIRQLRRDGSRRALHSRPAHKHIKDGRIPGFLEQGAYRIAWTEHQQWLIDNLNRLVKDTPEEVLTPKDAAIFYARDANNAAAFNYASMAHNNDFFFKGIHESPSQISPALTAAIEKSFSSVESFRDTMLATADAMFGPGFVWLVAVKDRTRRTNPLDISSQSRNAAATPDLKILTTYLAGSPYAQAHWRKQSQETATMDYGVKPNETGSSLAFRNPSFPAYGFQGQHKPSAYKGSSLLPPGAADVVPLLCVSTWEHAWLPQYGVGCKDIYLEKWWDRIEWSIVEENYRRR